MAGGGTILIVDDEPLNIRLLASMLQSDYEVLIATDGRRGIELATSARPDLILLDVVMPGLDGYQVCATIKASDSTKHIPVLFLTGRTELDDETRGLELGAVDYLTKPYSPALVKVRVRNHIELKKMRDKFGTLDAKG